MVVADGGRGDERWWWRAKEEAPAGGGARCHDPRRRERERMGTGDVD
jgi:hypothetical protein